MKKYIYYIKLHNSINSIEIKIKEKIIILVNKKEITSPEKTLSQNVNNDLLHN